jgi:DNA-binding CsgD family transcriptional regulator
MPVGTPTPRMWGRDEPWARVLDVLDDRRRSQGTVLVLDGEPGTGKSRMLAELAGTARRRGYPVVERRGWMAPDAVRRLAVDCDGLTATGPVVVAWDEPRWGADDVLGYLAERAAGSPVLWVLAGPMRAPDGTTAGVTVVRLGPLEPADGDALAGDLLGARPSPQLSALVRVAAANPRRIVELSQVLLDENAIVARDGVADLAPVVSAGVRAHLRRSLGTVSAETRRLMLVASAIGLTFGLADLAELMRNSAAGLLPHVEEALASGLVVTDGEGLAFAHELVRSAVAESVPAGVHRTLREEAAGRLGLLRAVPDPRASTAPRNDPPRAADQLSHRERVIARFVGQGLTNRQIAARLYLSPHTVNFHLRQIFRKLDINSRVRLVGLTYAQMPDYPEAS